MMCYDDYVQSIKSLRIDWQACLDRKLHCPISLNPVIYGGGLNAVGSSIMLLVSASFIIGALALFNR